MVCYKCDTCMFSSKIKTHYNRHLKTKKHQSNYECVLIAMVKTQKDPEKTQKDPEKTQKDPEKTQEKSEFLCDFCDSTFSSYAHKRRHELHRCKENTSEMTKKITSLEKEKKKLEKKIEKLLDKVGTINNTTNNNTNNIIVVNNYGKENTDYLTVDKIKALLDRPYDSVQELIKMLHFNSEHPENHNVKITNKKEPYALVWNDPIWELRKKKAVVKDIVDKGYMMIDTTHDNMDESNTKYINFQTNFDDDATNIKDKIEEETEIVIINETKKIEC
jgi:hypothetical protein